MIPVAAETTLDVGSIAQWAGALATFLAVLVALFKEDLVQLWRRPKLTLSITLAPPDCHKTQLTFVGIAAPPIDCYYLRIWVKNEGKTRAEAVQVFAAGLAKKAADGSFRRVESFLPMNLKWSHAQVQTSGPEIFAEGISPGMGKHCDLGRIAHPNSKVVLGENLPGVPEENAILILELEIQPNTRSHLVPPGTYLLELRVAGANCSPVSKTLEFTLTGQWFDEESRMFRDGFGLRMVG